MKVPSKGLEWTNLVLGGVLATAAIAMTGPLASWNAAVVGTLIVCCSVVALYRYSAWTEWTNLILGCWTFVAPFLPGFGSAQGPTLMQVVIGLCIAAIATAQLMAGGKLHEPSSTKSLDG